MGETGKIGNSSLQKMKISNVYYQANREIFAFKRIFFIFNLTTGAIGKCNE